MPTPRVVPSFDVSEQRRSHLGIALEHLPIQELTFQLVGAPARVLK
jgi:hypothetical protein